MASLRESLGRGVLAVAVLLLTAGLIRTGEAAKYSDKECGRCHDAVVKAMAVSGGKHREVGCTNCHEGHPPGVERPFPDCTACHEPHSEDPASADCTQCHRAHAPTEVKYGVGVPSAACGACHPRPLAELAATPTKHGALSCAICHRAAHKATRACGDCHGRLHPESILTRFPGCGHCHHTAHDLNHWPDAQ